MHFAVYDSGNVVETYQAPNLWWKSPHAYAGDVFGSLDFGITDHFPSNEELVDRPVDQDLFFQGDGIGQIAYSWVNLFGFHAGDQLDYYFYRPDGTEYSHSNWTMGDIRYGWWVAGVALPDVPDLGLWTMSARRNSSILYSDSFSVAVPEPSCPAILAISGIAFAVLRRRRVACLADHRSDLVRAYK